MKDLEKKLKDISEELYSSLLKLENSKQLITLRVHFLGKKGIITALLSDIKNLSPEEKRTFGSLINKLKIDAETKIDEYEKLLISKEMESHNTKLQNFDVTASKILESEGHLHPYTHIIEEIENIFISMGYEVLDGPEVETDFNNFGALNIPQNHPARDMYDTFWLKNTGMLLRTHTSSMQVKTMQTKKFPIAAINPGRCFRHEATDASHDFMFMQCEGFLIDKNITLSNLFGTAKKFLSALFGIEDLNIRIRPGFFPFVEPGVEIDMQCPFCDQGCSVCKKSRWIEVFPGGMIHPNVLRAGGIDPEEYSGFAFGFGLTRLAMIKYRITDIRLLHNNKMKFLEQF